MPQVNFLPWAKVEQTLTLGPVSVVPWSDLASRMPQEPAAFLRRYFSRYLTNDGRPIEEIAIAYVGDDPLADLSVSDRAVIQRSVDVLTFVAIADQRLKILRTGNIGFGVPNSERFQVITQTFTDMKPHIAVLSGGVSHGWDLDEIHFCIPWCVGGEVYRTDQRLLLVLAEFVHRPTSVAHRLGRALEWFRLAHTGNDDTSELSRVVMMATAFEILLDPSNQKRRDMAQTLHQIVASDDVQTKTITFGTEEYHLAMPAIWLNDFYRLRNAIVHGDEVPAEKLQYQISDRQSVAQRAVAALVVWEIVVWWLFEAGLLAEGAYEIAKLFTSIESDAEPEPQFVRRVAADELGVSALHAALEWRVK